MKKLCLLLLVFPLLLGFYINNTMEESIAGILKQLEITDEYAKDYVWSNCSGNLFYFPNPRHLKDLPKNERAAIVKIVGDYARQYALSEDFKQKYINNYEAGKPEPPQAPESIDDMKKQQKENLTKSIAEMENMMKTMPEQKSMFEETIVSLKEQLKEIDNPDNPMFSSEMQGYMQQGYDTQVAEYNSRLAEWEKNYPKNQNAIIKKWLTEFLEISSNIDFKAALKDNGYGKKVFVNSEYEKKPHLWKLCFRAGKETVDAGRAYANSWMKELN